MNKLDPKAFGLALGILLAASMVFMGLTAMACSWAQPFVDAVSMMYVGYSATIVGVLIGAAWGFVDAFVGGVLFAWLYNKLVKA